MMMTTLNLTSKIDTRPARPAAPRPTTQIIIGLVVIPLLLAAVITTYFFYSRSQATSQLVVPRDEVLLVRTLPDETSPLLARFGEGRALTITGRSEDWRWLEVELWGGRQGWALRPLDILVWRLEAAPKLPQTAAAGSLTISPVAEEMIALPATNFTMGSPPGLGEADEQPAHSVSLTAFEIDRTEVTVGQYWTCVEAGACQAPAQDGTPKEPHYLNDPAFDNHPVVNIPWTEATNYCTWLGKRLPTEAEWEMAAGWNSQQNAKLSWPWGNTSEQAQVNLATAGPTTVGTSPGDRSPAGVLDMGGNVSEWVFDWYKVDYYKVADDSDPVGPTHRRGEGTGRVVRGGAYADTVEAARVANRHHQAENYGYATIGFRCARDSSSQ